VCDVCDVCVMYDVCMIYVCEDNASDGYMYAGLLVCALFCEVVIINHAIYIVYRLSVRVRGGMYVRMCVCVMCDM